MMSPEQMSARAEAIVVGIEHALKTKGRNAATEMLLEHLVSFGGAAANAVQDDNARLLEEIGQLYEWIDDAPDRTVALAEAGAKTLYLLTGDGDGDPVEGDTINAVQKP
jgi:hypothetical protein